ncbi:hypothetical protein R5R35_002121 [Gryllus longicercus]
MAGKSLPEQNSRTALTLGDGSPARVWPQALAAGVATLGALSVGTCLGWMSPALPLLQDKTSHFLVSDEEASWIGSLLTLGAALGAAPAGLLAARAGPRRAVVLLGLPLLASWLLIAFSASVAELYAGRLLGGAAMGALCVAAPMYVGEMAEARVRGVLGGLFQLQVTAGILLAYGVGLVGNARTLSLVCAAVPAVLVAALPWLPESPVWLLGRGRDAEAARALRWFRGGADPEFELLRMRATLNTAPSRASAASVDALRRGGLRRALAPDRAGARALLVVLGLMAVQQLSGINAVIFYLSAIFANAGSALSPAVAAIVAGVVQVLATASGAALSDRAGRRPLLLLSAAVMALCLGTLGCCYQWPHALPGWLPLLTVALFLVVFSLGFGPVPWLMMGELLAPEVKASASALAVTLNWMLAFGVTKTFGPLLRLLGSPGTFFAFSAICVAGALFVLLLVPETKGKDPTTIQAELAGRHGRQRVGTKPV